jgi:hypothetical protein
LLLRSSCFQAWIHTLYLKRLSPISDSYPTNPNFRHTDQRKVQFTHVYKHNTNRPQETKSMEKNSFGKHVVAMSQVF